MPATRLLAAVLAVAFLLVSAALLAPPAAADPAVTVPAPAASGPLTLELSGLAPRVVTADGPASVTVTGTLRNTGDRLVGDLEVRLQRGEALRTDGDVRDALAGDGRADAATPAFTPLPGTLAPGASMPVTLTVPLRGDPTEGLALDRPGVYELLVNVNGVPRDGLRARLAAARLLLPVLSLPAGPDPGVAPVEPTAPGDPPGLTVLYPLVDTPHRLPTVPGEQTLLADDDLAGSLAPDGRLGGLLAAFAEGAPAGSAVRAATCLAVDPDLVATAAAMRQGYAVRGPERDGARHRRRRRGHLAGHAGGGRARRLRRRTAVRRRRPRRAGPRAARRPRPAGRRRCGGGRHRGPRHAGTRCHHLAQRGSARRAGARRRRRRRCPGGGAGRLDRGR